jgi:hypothetical protein
MAQITLTYNPPDGSADISVTVRAPEWGNQDEQDHQQVVLRMLSNDVRVLDRGNETRRLGLDFAYLNVTERGDIERFFSEHGVKGAARWFVLRFDPPDWPDVIRAGAAQSGATIKANTVTLVGKRITHDVLDYHARVIDPRLLWSTIQDGHYALALNVETLREGALPTNEC